MSLMEKNRVNVPVNKARDVFSFIKRNAYDTIKRGIEKYGILGLVILIMVISSGLRLLWSSNFPIGWWIVLGLLIVNEVIKDKFVWKKDIEISELQKQLKEAKDIISKNTNASTDK